MRRYKAIENVDAILTRYCLTLSDTAAGCTIAEAHHLPIIVVNSTIFIAKTGRKPLPYNTNMYHCSSTSYTDVLRAHQCIHKQDEMEARYREGKLLSLPLVAINAPSNHNPHSMLTR